VGFFVAPRERETTEMATKEKTKAPARKERLQDQLLFCVTPSMRTRIERTAKAQKKSLGGVVRDALDAHLNSTMK
jgi:hypothetical protein